MRMSAAGTMLRPCRPSGAVIFAIVAALVLCLATGKACAERVTRLALVITNANYPKEVGALDNPHADGATMAAALKEVGFGDIRHVRDADFQTMRLELAGLAARAEKAGPEAVVFFYYSGHGAADRAERGENFLIPVKAPISTAVQLPALGLALGEIVKVLERIPAKARFAVIDACRNVAFTKGVKDAAKGFTAMRKLDGILLAFATRPGDIAKDTGIYARTLAENLVKPGLAPERVFKLTQLAVAKATQGDQVPWIEDGLLVEGFRFNEATAARPAPVEHGPAAAVPRPGGPSCPAPSLTVSLGPGRARCIAPGSGAIVQDCETCPELVVVPAGPAAGIAKPFAVGRFEITRAEWTACYKEGACSFKTDDDGPGRQRWPMTAVSLDDIVTEYLPWLARRTGRRYRLPSVSEWEHAARAGTTTAFHWGDDIGRGTARCTGCPPDARPETATVVGSYAANQWGLFDVSGNVWEWTADCSPAAPAGGAVAPLACRGPAIRGGAWSSPPEDLRLSVNRRLAPGTRLGHVGFRVARDLD